MKTFNVTANPNIVRIDFDLDYFFANCDDATIDFDELNINPTFIFTFADNKPVIADTNESIIDSSHLEQLFNSDVLAALIAVDARFDF